MRYILDIDPGIDDALALICALKGNIPIDAITICSGNVDSQQGAKNAFYLLKLLQRTDIPIYVGPETTLYQPYQDARDTHGEDGLGEVYFPDQQSHQKEPAPQFLVDAIRSNPGSISLMALGPLTNLALAEQQSPGVLSQLKELRIMGGVHTVPGNCSAVAEYNFWCDPIAAQIVFESQLPETYLYPLDVTYQALLTPNVREFIHQQNDPIGDFIDQITRFYVDFHWRQERTLGCVINDPLVILDRLNPGLVTFERAWLEVRTDGPERGQGVTRFDSDGPIQVGVSADGDRFIDCFIRTCLPDAVEDWNYILKDSRLNGGNRHAISKNQ